MVACPGVGEPRINRPLSLSARTAGLFYSLRQSLELDTGVSHHSLANRFTARLRTRSPSRAFRLPTLPSPHLQMETIQMSSKQMCGWILI